MRKKELIQEIISSHGQKHKNSVDHRFLDVCRFEPETIHEGQIRGSRGTKKIRKKERKDDLSLLSDDKDDNEEECTSTIWRGHRKSAAQWQFNDPTQIWRAKHEEPDERSWILWEFEEEVCLGTWPADRVVCESKKWELWDITEDELLVVTRIWMERTVNKQKLPLKQGKGSVAPAFIHTLKKTKKKTGALNPPIVQRAFGSLDSWSG